MIIDRSVNIGRVMISVRVDRELFYDTLHNGAKKKLLFGASLVDDPRLNSKFIALSLPFVSLWLVWVIPAD